MSMRSIQDQIENPPFTQIMPSRNYDSENQPPANTTGSTSVAQRPSEGWLRNPAWIGAYFLSYLYCCVVDSSLLLDGGVNPPRFYHSHEEIDEALRNAGVSRATRFDQQAARISPTPALPLPPVPLTLDLVNSANPGSNVGINATSKPLFSPLELILSSNNFLAVSSGHIVNVTLIYTAPAAPTVGRAKAAPKKAKTTKMDNIPLESITRVDFIKAFLATHGLAETFSPGTHSGPDFKLWWTGMRCVDAIHFFLKADFILHSGGKAGAPSIQNDHQFGIAFDALRKRNKSTTIEIGRAHV